MTSLNVKDLLLAQRLNPEQVAALLKPYGFKDPQKADSNLQSTAADPAERELLADILTDLLICASRSADPDQALTYFERFARAALNKTRLFTYLKESPPILEILMRTLGGSPYMAEILIRDPQHFYWVTDPETLHQRRTKRTIQGELLQALRAIQDEKEQLDYLRFLKRREMLHIGMRDLLRLCSVEETLTALSTLAEALISTAYWICASALRREYEIRPGTFNGFTILAMGKLGGAELNFSSDVDLIYVYAPNQADAPTISAQEYFSRLCRRITVGLNNLTSEGYVFRVDLRLRPEGKDGDITYSLDGYERYYQSRLATWERLALLKAWPVAGDCALGRAFLKMARKFIYDLPFGRNALDDVSAMKRKIDEQMVIREQSNRNVKLGTGGIREIELVTQSLQIRNGGRIPEIHERNTLKALALLCEHSVISDDECEKLTRAYLFLRNVENKLQMVNDAQTHSLPQEQEELNTCARLLGYSGADEFMRDYQHHTGRVNSIFETKLS